MKILLPDELKLKITRKLLDWVEDLPKSANGYIQELQVFREHEQKHSEEAYIRTRRPDGTEIEFLGIRLIEIFLQEDFQKAKSGLLQLFPDERRSPVERPFSERFQQLGENIMGGGYENLGYIYRDKFPLISPQSKFRMNKLPPEVSHIHVYLHKLFSSMFVISFDVYLTDYATKEITQLHEEHYLSDTRIESIYRNLKLIGISGNMPSTVMKNAILNWLEILRERIEVCIRPFITGYFTQQSTGKVRLPAIEVYGLKGHLARHNNFISWAIDAHQWWKSLGFSFYNGLYGNEEVLFNWSQHQDGIPNAAHRMIVLWEPYIKTINHQDNSDEEGYAIFYGLHYFLNTFLMPFIMVEFLRNFISKIEKLRGAVFSSMKQSRSMRINLSRHIRLYRKLQQERMILDRLELEFNQIEDYCRREISEAKIMVSIQILSGKSDTEENFANALFLSIRVRQALLHGHIAFLDNTFTTFIKFLNIDAVYRLQLITLCFTIAAVIASIVGLAANWKNIEELMGLLFFFK